MGTAMIRNRINRSPQLKGLPLKILMVASGEFEAVLQAIPPTLNLSC